MNESDSITSKGLAVGGHICITRLDDVIEGKITALSKGKKGVQIAIQTRKGSRTCHIPNNQLRRFGLDLTA